MEVAKEGSVDNQVAGNGATSSAPKSFVKILVGDFKNRLRVPDIFVEFMVQQSLDLCGTATLHSPNDNCRKVKLKKLDKGVYFEDGWEIFARDHSLAYTQLLLFRYIGSMHFEVTVFDKSSSELKDALNVKSTEGAICGCASHGHDGTSKPKDPFHVKLAEGVILGHESHGYDGTSKLKDTIYVKPDEGAMCCLSHGRDASPLVRRSSQKRKTMDAAYPLTSPYFVVDLVTSSVARPFNMTVPNKFAREHLPEYTTTLFLKDETETTREVTLNVRQRQSAFTSGWKAVVENNDLRVGDRCVFELVDKCVLQLHIHRRDRNRKRNR